MSWAAHHEQSEKYAAEAERCALSGDKRRSDELYRIAAQHELAALEALTPDKKRTLGITAVSAASLAFKGNDLRQAERVACKWLATDSIPAFAVDQLQKILQAAWSQRAYQAAGVEFVRGEVLVSVGGGLVVRGAAPLDLVHRKVDEVKNLFYRTVELLLNRPCRRRGVPSSDIREQFRPWLLQAPPGSYQFAIRVEKPRQLLLFPDATPEVEDVTRKFLQIIDAASKENHEEFETVVPDADYRESFLKQTRNLAPTGKAFERLEIRSTLDTEAPPILLSPGSRDAISATLRRSRVAKKETQDLRAEQVVGALRALHLDQDWLEVAVPGQDTPTRIHQTGDVIDDVVGPMVNHRVIVDVAVSTTGKYFFRDIQSEE